MTIVKIKSVPYGSRGETTKARLELLKTSVPEIKKAIRDGRAMEYDHKTLTELQVIHKYRGKPQNMFMEDIYGLAKLTLAQITRIKTLNLVIVGQKDKVYSFSKRMKMKSGPAPTPKEKLFKRIMCSFSPELAMFFEFLRKKHYTSRSGFLTKTAMQSDEFREFEKFRKSVEFEQFLTDYQKKFRLPPYDI